MACVRMDNRPGAHRIPFLFLTFLIVLTQPVAFAAPRTLHARSAPFRLPSPLLDVENICQRHGHPSAICDPHALVSPSAAAQIDRILMPTTHVEEQQHRHRAYPSQLINQSITCRTTPPASMLIAVLTTAMLHKLNTTSAEIGPFSGNLHNEWCLQHHAPNCTDVCPPTLLVVLSEQPIVHLTLGGSQLHDQTRLNPSLTFMVHLLRSGKIDQSLLEGVHPILQHLYNSPNEIAVSSSTKGSGGFFGLFFTLPEDENSKGPCSNCFLEVLVAKTRQLVPEMLRWLYRFVSGVFYVLACALAVIVLFESLRTFSFRLIQSYTSGARPAVKDWDHIAYLTPELIARGQTTDRCRLALKRIERDRDCAMRGEYVPTCCPLCLEDFDESLTAIPSARPVDDARLMEQGDPVLGRERGARTTRANGAVSSTTAAQREDGNGRTTGQYDSTGQSHRQSGMSAGAGRGVSSARSSREEAALVGPSADRPATRMGVSATAASSSSTTTRITGSAGIPARAEQGRSRRAIEHGSGEVGCLGGGGEADDVGGCLSKFASGVSWDVMLLVMLVRRGSMMSTMSSSCVPRRGRGVVAVSVSAAEEEGEYCERRERSDADGGELLPLRGRGTPGSSSSTGAIGCLSVFSGGRNSVGLRCGHWFHMECLEPMLGRVKGEDRCPVCLSSVFLLSSGKRDMFPVEGEGWWWFYDEYMFRLRRAMVLYRQHITQAMVNRWLQSSSPDGAPSLELPLLDESDVQRIWAQ